MRNLDLGVGTPLTFGRAEHQSSHKVWGTQLDQAGRYQAIELQTTEDALDAALRRVLRAMKV